MKERDQGEGDRRRHEVDREPVERSRKKCEARRQEGSQSWFDDEAEPEAGERDAELIGGDAQVEMIESVEDRCGPADPLGVNLLHPCPANGDESELRGDEKAIEDDEERERHDRDDPERDLPSPAAGAATSAKRGITC